MARWINVTAMVLLMLGMPVAARGATTPTLSGTALGSGQIGAMPLQDQVKLSGTNAGTGTITFSLFGPGDPTCEGTPINSSTVVVHGDQEYVSSEYFPFATGAYGYVASYSGDTENEPVATTCGTPAQNVTVTSATPQLLTSASNGVVVGEGIFDTAGLLGGYGPTGSITFRLYGPGDTTCSLPIDSFITPINEEARFKSPTYTALAEGQYLWVASYSGDSVNLPTADRCGEEGESVLVTQGRLPATLHVHASSVTGEVQQVAATAIIVGSGGGGGVLTFRVYGPNDPSCQHGTIAASTQPVPGDGEYASDPFESPAPGKYEIIASYAGANGVTAETACGEPGSEVEVRGAEPPVLDKSITVARLSGTVLIQVHAAAARHGASASSNVGFVEVRGSRVVPVGSTIDTEAGTAKLTAATTQKRFQSGVFAGSRFIVRQQVSDHGVVELDLRPGPTARKSCRSIAHHASTARHVTPPHKLLARLHAVVKGQFRTTGKNSSASAHGTSWETLERCDGTLTRVLSDIVMVRDFHRHRSILVHAGHSYLARASG